MITMDEERTESPDDMLTPEEAAAYLAKRWGRESFSVEGLRSLRRRLNLTPAKQLRRTTLYARRQLDTIDEPVQRNPYKQPLTNDDQ